jgi:AcrR family transcriptional regulator
LSTGAPHHLGKQARQRGDAPEGYYPRMSDSDGPLVTAVHESALAGQGGTSGRDSRAAILQAARTLYATNGSRGTSLASIANAAGLSQPGLLHHFPSKSALLLAVLAERDREDGELSSAHLVGDGLDILGALASLVEHNQGQPEIVRLFSVLLGESLSEAHPAHSQFATRYQRIRSRILRKLRRAEARKQIRDGVDLEALSPVIVAVMDGLQYQWLLDDSVDMTRSFQVFCDLLVRGLTAS